MKHSIDYSLYLVTNRDLLLEDFFRVIQQAVEGGFKIVQLREKDISAREMITIGKKLKVFLKPLGIPLIINDRVDVAFAVQADGVHLGQADISVRDARKILGKDAIIGLSVETLEQGISAQIEEVNYITASPVFPAKTKKDWVPPWNLADLKQLCSFSKFPVIAIGGIDLTNLDQILNCGVCGVAIISALFSAPCPKVAAQIFSDKIKTHINSPIIQN